MGLPSVERSEGEARFRGEAAQVGDIGFEQAFDARAGRVVAEADRLLHRRGAAHQHEAAARLQPAQEALGQLGDGTADEDGVEAERGLPGGGVALLEVDRQPALNR